MRAAVIGLVLSFVLGGAAVAGASPVAFTTGFGPDFCQLYSVDAPTGQATAVGGSTPEYCAIALAVAPDGRLFGVSQTESDAQVLVRIDPATGDASLVGELGFTTTGANFEAITFDPEGNLWLVANSGDSGCADTSTSMCLYRVDPESAATTLIGGESSSFLSGLAWSCSGILYATTWPGSSLATVDPSSAAVTTIGPLGSGITAQGLSTDGDGVLWALDAVGFERPFHTATVDATTGQATVIAAIAGLDDDAVDAGSIALAPPSCVAPAPLEPPVLAPTFTG